jgi:hypothetical protein
MTFKSTSQVSLTHLPQPLGLSSDHWLRLETVWQAIAWHEPIRVKWNFVVHKGDAS